MQPQKQDLDEFKCPYSLQIMKDSVFLADGMKFQRGAIQKWIQTNNTNPITGKILHHKQISSNQQMKKKIQQYFLGSERETFESKNIESTDFNLNSIFHHLLETYSNKRREFFVKANKHLKDFSENRKKISVLKNSFPQEKNLYGGKYRGMLQSNHRSGLGIIEYQAQENQGWMGQKCKSYEGQWKNDLYDGMGVLKAEHTWKGVFKEGLLNGFGEWMAKSSHSKKRFKKFVKSLQIMNYMKSTNYQEEIGDKIHGKKSQLATFLSSEIQSIQLNSHSYRFYFGQWVNSKFEGFGLKDFCYQGEFKNGKYEGLGLLLRIEYFMYFGEWKNGLFHGFGVLHDFKLQRNYIGFWKEGKKHGKGRQMASQGNVFMGTWSNGEKTGSEKLKKENEGTYVEYWKNGRPSQNPGIIGCSVF